MAILDDINGMVVLRIVYAGPPLSGKTQTVRALASNLLGTRHADAVYTPDEAGNRTLYFDWLEYSGGSFQGRRIRCQIVAVPGQSVLFRRRQLLLQAADVVVFVVDARPEYGESITSFYDEMRQIIDKPDETAPVGVIVQANKSDLPGALVKEDLHHLLGDDRSLTIVPTVATQGTGLRETFVQAVGLGLARVRTLMEEGRLRPTTEPLEIASGQDLLKQIKEIEDAELGAVVAPRTVFTTTTLSDSLSAMPPVQSLPLQTADLEKHEPSPGAALVAERAPEPGPAPAEVEASPVSIVIQEMAPLMPAPEVVPAPPVATEAVHAPVETVPAPAPEVIPVAAVLKPAPEPAPEPVPPVVPEPRAAVALPLAPAPVLASEPAPQPPPSPAVEQPRPAPVAEPVAPRPVEAGPTPKPEMPDKRVAAGMVWPPIAGRHVLNEITDSRPILRQLKNQAWLGESERWLLLSLREHVFDNEMNAREEMLRLARSHAQFKPVLSDHRCISCALTGQGGWRIWQVVRRETTLADVVRLMLDLLTADSICTELLRIAYLLDAAATRFRTAGLPCEPTLDKIAVTHGGPVFTGFLLTAEGGHASPATTDGPTLVRRELEPAVVALNGRRDLVQQLLRQLEASKGSAAPGDPVAETLIAMFLHHDTVA